MMPRLLIPTGRWKVDAESANEQSTIRLSGRAFLDTWKMDQPVQTVLLTRDQAHELVSALNLALLELELQRAAHLARTAGCAG
jgi:FMN-dependent NADH-azoreductase